MKLVDFVSPGDNAGKAKGKGHVLEKLRPTYTHEAIVKLFEMGLIKYVISQNTDGMHRYEKYPSYSEKPLVLYLIINMYSHANVIIEL